MKQPTSLKSILAVIFLLLGFTFLLECICFVMGFFIPDPDSVLNPGLVFFVVSLLSFLFALILALFVLRNDRRNQRLQHRGLALDTGKLLIIQPLRFVSWAGKHPFRLYYTYHYEGVTYQGKSPLIWTKPDTREGNLCVYVDPTFPSRSALKLL